MLAEKSLPRSSRKLRKAVTSNSRPTITTTIHARRSKPIGEHSRGDDQENERAADDDLVGERVEDAAQRGDLIEFAGVVAVEPVRADGDQEQDEGGNIMFGRDQPEEHHRQEQAQAGQLVRQVECLAERVPSGFGGGAWEWDRTRDWD